MTIEQLHSEEPDIERIGRAVVDVATAWDARLGQVIRQDGSVYALRGAGSTSGIDPLAVGHVVEDELVPRIEHDLSRRPVAVVYDGDLDNRSKPDIGTVAGMLLDRFDGRGVSFLAAQTGDWYYPPVEGSNLTNASGRSFETFVFPRGHYDGDHNRFTQSDRLVRHPFYGQYYIGASGDIAAGQMADYVRRVPAGQSVRVTVVRALINQALSQEIGDKLAQAVTDAEQAKYARMLEQRRRIYGAHWNNDGSFDKSFLQEVRRADDDHELVVLWSGSQTVEVVNCGRIDLASPDIEAKFATAGYFVKTAPVRARRVPAGTTETVIVKSGAARDTAQGGDMVCTSLSGEEYVVHAEDFDDIYEVAGEGGMYVPKRDPRKLVKLDKDVIFTAPWGGDQAVRRGGYLIERTIRSGKRAGMSERYGIAEQDAADMVPA